MFQDDFRGTKESLKKLIDDDRHHRSLLQDIWRFYRAERIYLLQILKEIVSHSVNLDHPHHKELDKLMDKLNGRDQFKTALLGQLRAVITEPPPGYERNGKHFGGELQTEWVRVNLREQSELLQIFLLFLQTYGNKYNTGDILAEFLELCYEHVFGHRQRSEQLLSSAETGAAASADLSGCVGALETLILMNLIDLPTLTVDAGQHCICSRPEEVAKVNKAVSGLGSRPEHGPVMLSWMLAHYLMDADSLGRWAGLGERALQLDAVGFLARIVENPVISKNTFVCNIAKGICYATACVLVTAFEPASMGLAGEIQGLSKSLFSHDAIALDFWKQGFEVLTMKDEKK